MTAGLIAELQQLGLTQPEAQVYTTLLHNGSLGASAIAHQTGVQRSNVYPVLWSLADKGLVEGGAGYGSKFTAVLPDDALPALVVRERETLAKREYFASDLARRMAAFVNPGETAPQELIEVIRHPKVIAERFKRLQLEAKRQVDGIVKAPILSVPLKNPAQQKAQKRGVRYRALYERAVLDEPSIKPYLKAWIDEGEEARVFDGEVPHKLIIFDRQIVLLPLIMPGDQTRTLIVRHPQLAQSLSLLFEFLWAQAKPLSMAIEDKMRSRSAPAPGQALTNTRPMNSRSDGQLSSQTAKRITSSQ